MAKWHLIGPKTKESESGKKALIRAGYGVTRLYDSVADGALDDQKPDLAMTAVDMIVRSDGLIMFSSLSAGLGAEDFLFGLGLGLNKRLVVIGTRGNVMLYLPTVEFYQDFPTFLTQLKTEPK